MAGEERRTTEGAPDGAYCGAPWPIAISANGPLDYFPTCDNPAGHEGLHEARHPHRAAGWCWPSQFTPSEAKASPESSSRD